MNSSAHLALGSYVAKSVFGNIVVRAVLLSTGLAEPAWMVVEAIAGLNCLA
jgi:hypothetical protein